MRCVDDIVVDSVKRTIGKRNGTGNLEMLRCINCSSMHLSAAGTARGAP